MKIKYSFKPSFEWGYIGGKDPYLIEQTQDIGNGNSFSMVFNTKSFRCGDIITYDKFMGQQIYINQIEPINVGSGWLYSVRTITNHIAWPGISPNNLQVGTKFFRLGGLA